MKATIAILNVYHMGETGRHLVQGIVDEVLSPERQAELETLSVQLARYKPTKVLVEVLPEREASLNRRYQDYRLGRLELGRNEIEQIGFRLAKRMDHACLYAVDDFNEVGARLLSDDPFKNCLQTELFQRLINESKLRTRQLQELLDRKGLHLLLLYLNSPEYMREDHRHYIRLAQLGEEVAIWVQWWYGRNLRIVLNILRVAEQGDRLLLIIGSGHGYLIRQLVQEEGTLRIRDIRKYLAP